MDSVAERLAREVDTMLVLGSSLTVHPAAMLPQMALRAGAKLVIVNAQPTPLDRYAALHLEDLSVFAKWVVSRF